MNPGPVIFAAALTAFYAIPSLAQSDVMSEAQRLEIASLTERFMTAGHYPSITVAIDQGGESLYTASMGSANLEHDIPAQPTSAYAIGSITKSFTALTILVLVAEGKLSLEQPLSAYLPDYAGPAQSVPIRRLLDHSSGIPNYTSLPGLNPKLRRTVYSREQMVAFFEKLPLEFEPGDKFSYSNSGYYLLVLIIEAQTGLDYYDALDLIIFQPLGLEHTYNGNDSEIIPERVAGYGLGPLGFVNAPPWSNLVPFSAGSLISTAADLIRYRRGVFTSDVYPDSVKKHLGQTYPLNDGTIGTYTIGGLLRSEIDGHAKYAHSGDIWGYAADHAWYPDDDITIVILTNHQAEAPSVVSLEQKIARVMFGLPQPDISDLTLKQDELDRLQGDFLLHPFLFGPPRYGFVGEQGKLYLRFGGIDAGGPKLPLLAQGDGRFVMAFDDEWVFQFSREQNRAQSFAAQTRDGNFYAARIDP